MEELSYLEIIRKEKKINKKNSRGVIQGIFLWVFFTVEFYFMLLVLISTILAANAPSLVSNILLKSE